MVFEGNGFVQPTIPRFDGHYDHWSMLMEKFLRSKEYWDLIENGMSEPAEGETLIDAQVKSSLLVHEQKHNRANEVEEQTTLKTYTHAESSSNRGRDRERGGRGRGNRDGSNPSHSSKRDNDSLGKGRGQYDTSKIE
ncbi:unnamed protein product [Prunus armeniaca]